MRQIADITLNGKPLAEILDAHGKWLRAEKNGIMANLREANLREANLREANLNGADLSGANLRGANLRGADLNGAYLREANLREANLNGADLSGANLRGANLRGADLSGANLRGANLRGADLSGANLNGADLRGAKCIMRVGPASDGYEFFGGVRNGAVWIKAGCRWFTAADARAHWRGTRADTPLGAERLAFVDFIEATFRARGEIA